MAHTYILVNRHGAEQCAALMEEANADPWPTALKDTDVLCLCPSGEHEAWFVVDTDAPEAIVASLPPLYRAGTTVAAAGIARVGEAFPVA